jgi:hypothetical protein
MRLDRHRKMSPNVITGGVEIIASHTVWHLQPAY